MVETLPRTRTRAGQFSLLLLTEMDRLVSGLFGG